MKDDQVTLRLPRELARSLARTARARGVPKSQLVREALQAYLVTETAAEGEAWARVAPLVGSLALDPTAVEREALSRQMRSHNWRE